MADSVKIKITGDDREFQNTLSGIGQKAGSVFKGIMASQIVTKGISMLTSGLKSAIDTGMQFEASMSQVAAISGATGRELELLTETAKHFGETTMFSASQAAEALNYMALAGWDAQQSVDALGGVLDLAAASGMDLGAASDAVTDYLSAFSMEASQAGYMADMMAYAQSKSNTTASMLADAYGNCASSMHAAGQDIETTTAMLMALANQGIKGSEAGTQMAAVMRDLTQKMDDGKIMIGKTAVQVTDAAGNFRDLNEIIADVGKATEGMGTAEQSAAIMTTFTARSVKAIQTILNEGMANVNAYEDALRGSEGTAAEQAKIMMDNLQGDIKIFQSALEGVQITASETMNSTARSIVQEGTSILEAVNSAGKSGGIGGMFDALIGQIPKLLPKVTKGVEGLLSGLGKRLPGLVKNLVATLPDLLGSMGDLVPSLIDSLTEAAGAAIEGLISNLPTLVPTLLTGVEKVLAGAGKGLENLVGGMFKGIGNALKGSGLMDIDLDYRIADAFKNVDTSGIQVDDIDLGKVSLDGEIDTQAYLDKIETAKTDLKTAVESLGLSESDAAALEKALLRGSGADALKAALSALNVPEADIDTVVTNIQGFKAKMDEVFATFGVNDKDGTISQNIADYMAQGGSLEEALQLFAGLSAEEAKTAAEDLQSDLDAAVAAISALNIDGLDTATIKQACLDANGDIQAALKLLGADDAAIQNALASVDTLKDNITTHLQTAFDDIKKAFTNGNLADDAEAASKAMEQLDKAGEKGHGKIDTWLIDYTAQLQTMNLSATEYETAVNNAQEKAQSMREELDATIQAAKDWVTANAGAATSEVEAHISELDGILSDIEQLEARVESLNSSLNVRDYSTRSAVERGVLGSQNAQATAIALTAKEYETSVTEAAAKYATAEQEALDIVEQASKDFASGLITAEERDAKELEAKNIIQEALDARTAAEEAASETYNQHMDAIMQGMLAANPKITAALDSVQQTMKNRQLAKDLFDAVPEAVRNNGAGMVTTDELLESMGMDEGSMQALADAIGMNVDDLYTQIGNALKSEDPASILANTELSNFAQGAEDAVAKALEGIDMSDAAAVLSKAMEEGWLVATDGIDWSDPEAALKQALIDYIHRASEETETEPVETKVPVETTVEQQNDPQEEIDKATEESVKRDRPRQLKTVIELDPEVELAENTPQEISDAMEESTQGADSSTTVAPEIDVEPQVMDPEAVRQTLVTSIQNATTGMKLGDVLAQADISQVDYDGMVAAMGLDPGALETAINGALASANPAEALTGVFAGVDLSQLTVPIGEDIANGTTQGIESGKGRAIAAATSLGSESANSVGDGAQVHSPSAITIPVGQGIAEGVTSGITSGTATAVAAAQTLGSSAASAVQSGATDTSSVGRQIAAGVASGILSGRSAVVSAAISVAQAAANAMKAALSIHSPSRVTEEFGRMFDQGFVVGINADAKNVVRSAVNMVNSVAGAANLAPKLDLSGITASMNGAISDLADVESNRDIAMYVNGREFARATTRENNTELNGFAKRISMGYGRG